jgi:hypothetical protein
MASNLDFMTSNSAIGQGNGSSMASIFQKTPAEIAKAAQTAAAKDKVKALVAVTVDTKPASLAPGEVIKVANDKGKMEYFVGTYDGKVSKPLTSVSSAVDAVNTQIRKAETVQATALRTAQKIEIDETRQALKDAGIPAKEIGKIITAEKAANTAEVTQLKGLLSAPNLQYGVRDATTNTFVNNSVNGVTTKPATSLTSLLTYNDATISPTIQTNIQSANESLAEFQVLKGITQPFLPSGNTTSGVNPYAIYQALDNGSIVTNKDTAGKTTGYTVSDAVAAAKGDQSGFMDATGMSKASARALGLILNNDVVIGGKANVVADADGNYFVNDASGADRYGKQKPLIDTGSVDANGNKIFAEVSTDNSKKNYVTVVSNYVQNKDGTFTYAGVDDTNYTYVEGFNPIKSLVVAGMSAGFGAGAGALSGLSGSAATAVGGAVGGATGAALSGSNILQGALLGGLGGFGVGEVQAAAQAAGGYENLLGQVSSGNFSSFTQAVQDAATFANSAAGSASGVDGGGGGYAGGGESQTSIDFGNTSVANGGFTNATDVANAATTGTELTNYGTTGTTGLGADMTYNTSASGQGIKLGYDSAGNIIDATTKLPFTGSGINFAKDAAGNFILDAAGNVLDAATGLPFQGEGVNLINFDTGNYVDTSANTGGLLDNVVDLGSNIVDTLGVGGTIIAGSTIIPEIVKAVTPGAKTDNTVYTAPLLTDAMFGKNGSTDWTQYYNNLFKRQGYGAGQFLGYDIMNKINVPAELMGLLGTSAQATPTTTA